MAIAQINKGQTITAAWLNELVAAVNRLEGGGSRGTGSDESAAALAISAAYPDVFVPARITRVTNNGTELQRWSPGGSVVRLGQAYFPSGIRYDLVGIRKGFIVVDALPVYGRPVFGDQAKVYPAAAGMVALIERTPKGGGSYGGNLMLLPGSEIVARKFCGGTGLRIGAGGNLLPPLPLELPPPPPPPPAPDPITRAIASAAAGAKSTGGGVAGADSGAGGTESTGGEGASQGGI